MMALEHNDGSIICGDEAVVLYYVILCIILIVNQLEVLSMYT